MPEPPEFSVGAAIDMGWEALKARYGLLLGASLLYFLILFISSIVIGISSLITFIPIADWIAQFLFYPLLWIGLYWIGIRIVRDEPASIEDMFAGFKRYWPVVGANALVLLVIYAITILAGILAALSIGGLALAGTMSSSSGGVAALIVAAVIILIMLVPVLLFVPRVIYAPLICLDTRQRTLGVVDSFKASWRMTGRPGVRVGIIVLWIVMMLTMALSFLLLILPFFFFAFPLAVAVGAASYWQISRGYWRTLEYQCNVCGYDLRGTRADHCPECGTPIPPEKFDQI